MRLHILVGAFLLIGFAALWVFANGRPPWGDEVHFLETVRLFGRGVSLELLRTYPEMSAPLTYLVYSAWGHVAGFSTPELRLLSPAIAWVTAMVWWFVIDRNVRSVPVALLVLGSIALNPYFVGLSIFVFTDMLSLLGLGLVVLGVNSRRHWLTVLGLAIATTSRQYLVFLAPALVTADVLNRPRSADRWRLFIAAFAGTVPLMLLIWLWDGHLAPASAVREVYLTETPSFDLHALALYLAVPGAYLALLVVPGSLKATGGMWIAAAAAGLFQFVFPIQASVAQTRAGGSTVGFLHKAASSSLPPIAATVLFCLLAALFTAAMLYCARRALVEWRAGVASLTDVFLWAAIVSFLLVMPFSYMPWEKYALPLLMLSSLVLAKVIAAPGAANAPSSTHSR